MRTVLVTGGAGYVGSHACQEFSRAGWHVVVFDNLSRGWRDAVRWGPLIEGDLLDREATYKAVDSTRPDVVVHFAAVAYVGESVAEPHFYYRQNVVGSLNLLDAMRDFGVSKLVFSSSCALYGSPAQLPITEDVPLKPINPYGRSKLMVEQILSDYASAHGLRSISLRYFNAAGCDPSGTIGERHEPETHVIPLAIMAAIEGTPFTINGTDFDTPDGTAIRDFVHVCDLARAHVSAAELCNSITGALAMNLGSETGTSIYELLRAIESRTGSTIRSIEAPRRVGDPAKLIASARRAQEILGWEASLSDLDTVVDTAYKWHHSMCS